MAASIQAFQAQSFCTTSATKWGPNAGANKSQCATQYRSTAFPGLCTESAMTFHKLGNTLPFTTAFCPGQVPCQCNSRNVGCSAQVTHKEGQPANHGSTAVKETLNDPLSPTNPFGSEFQLAEGALQYCGPVGFDGQTPPTLFEAGSAHFLPDASCHILIPDSGESVQQGQAVQENQLGLLKERALLEASFESPLNVSSPGSQDRTFESRLSTLSTLSSEANSQDENAPEDVFQMLQNILVSSARFLGAVVLASTLTLCSANPALAARSMGRAGGGGFSSSRSSSSGSSSRSSSGGSSHSSSSSYGSSSRSSSGGSSSSGFGGSSRSGSSGSSGHFSFSSPSSSSSKSSSRSGSSKSSGSSGGSSGLGHLSHSSAGTPNRSSSNGSKGSSGKGSKGKETASGSGKGGWFNGGASVHIEEEPHVWQSSPFRNPPPTIHLHATTPDHTFSSHAYGYSQPGHDNRLLDAILEALRGPHRGPTWQQPNAVPPQQKTDPGQQPKTDEGPGQKEPEGDIKLQTENLKPQDPFPHDVFVPLALTVLTAAGVYWAGSIALQRNAATTGATGFSSTPGATPMGEYDYDRKADRMTIVKIQVALLGQAKSVQVQMDQLCEDADTTTEWGLHKFLTETLLVISRHSAYWAYGNSQMSGMGYDKAEGRYQQIVMEERAKAEQETLVNTDGTLLRTASVRNADDDPPPNEFVVVTIVAALQGHMKSRDPAGGCASRESVKGAMRALSQVQPSDLQVLDILWVPQEDDDALTHAELIENFTDLTPM